MGSYIETDPEEHDATVEDDNLAWLQEDELNWAKGSVSGSDPGDIQAALGTLMNRLAEARRTSVRNIDVMRMNMMQQQAYHRLLGNVGVHHKDCPECALVMAKILTMIAQNIEHVETLLPEHEQVRLPDETPPA